ncbi:MAG: SUMF1/EgtB/PvdO family nonheme iron enzyme [Cyclobacteriaceae bacterium]|nr:SUMF1/EgtB/PvdO family nonheme iron enzyme [Cyclobacteriaceae bacterium SS2]
MRSSWIVYVCFFLSFSVFGQQEPFSQDIPGTDQSIDMVPISGGTFKMGSPESEAKRDTDEGPQRMVKVDGFWMGKYEITWGQFEAFMKKQDKNDPAASTKDQAIADAITRPSPPYEDPSFGMGKYGYPAGSMTHFSALMFCKWLSLKTGEFYRLPTEAEWEYACRAGSETAYYFGSEVEELDKYGWSYENAQYAYHPVGKLEPNAFGLYDMSGNVAEWTLDYYLPDYLSVIEGDPADNPWIKPRGLYPRTVKGGSYDDDPDRLRCASRIPTDPERWKGRDPQIPKSFWWNTDSPFVGFRIVKPFVQPTAEEQAAFWAINLDES